MNLIEQTLETLNAALIDAAAESWVVQVFVIPGSDGQTPTVGVSLSHDIEVAADLPSMDVFWYGM